MGPNTNRCVTRTPVRIKITSGYDLGILDTHLTTSEHANLATSPHNIQARLTTNFTSAYFYSCMTSNSTLDHAAPSFLVAFVTRQLHQTSAGLRATLATSGITPPAYTCQQTPTNRSTTSPGTAHHAASLNSQPASLTLLPQ